MDRVAIGTGLWHRPVDLADGCNCRQHMKDIKDADGKVVRSHVCGLELISTKAHWWLDTEIHRKPLQNEDWAIAHYFSEHTFTSKSDVRDESWQLPWAWEYECWREWQPWSDCKLWQKEFRAAVKQMGSKDTEWICGKRSRKECEAAAGLSALVPLWLLRDFANCFPETPWIAIPNEERKKRLAKTGITRESGYRHPPPLVGSVLTLKRRPLNIKQWTPGDNEALRAHQEWLEAPGYYDNERVQESSPSHYHGTYVIHVPWYWPDDVLDQAWVEWRKKHAQKLKGRRTLSYGGKLKWQDWLRQLGALRLLREMTAESAKKLTEEVLKGPPLYKQPKDWYTANGRAGDRLAKHFGMV